MGNNPYKKIDRISVKEIQKYEHELYLVDIARKDALNEMAHFLRELGSKNAYKFSGYVKMLRGLNTPLISDNLSVYIRSRSYFRLKRDIIKIIIKCPGDDYSSFEMYTHWKRFSRRIFQRFYYYSEQDYVNVYSIEFNDLPKYINQKFSPEDMDIYKNRLRGG